MAEIDNYLNIIRNATGGESVRDAIIDCMNEINKDSAFTVKERNISGRVSEIMRSPRIEAPNGVVYKSINLNIQNDDGSEGTAGTIVSHDFEVDVNTQNGNYDAKTLWGDNAQFGTVSVNLDFSDYNNNIKDLVEISTSDLEDDGSFSAGSLGYAAMKKIKFTNVNPVESKGGYIGKDGKVYFNIDYWDTDDNGNRTNCVGHASVASGDQVYSDEMKKKCVNPGGMTFGGWKPATAKQSGAVEAIWSNVTATGEGAISDSWPEIIQNGGRPYGYGQYQIIDVMRARIPYKAEKDLFAEYAGQQAYDNLPSTGYYEYSFSCKAIKVAEGEQGSSSTWLTDIISFGGSTSATFAGVPQHIADIITSTNYYPPDQSETTWAELQYEDSLFMKWWMQIFYKYAFPGNIKKGIINIPKWYVYANLDTSTYANHQVSDYPIWLPSLREMYIDDFDNSNGSYQEGSQGYARYVENATHDIHYMDNLQFSGIDGSKKRMQLFNITSVLSGFEARGSEQSNQHSVNDLSAVPCMTNNQELGNYSILRRFDSRKKYGGMPAFGFCIQATG